MFSFSKKCQGHISNGLVMVQSLFLHESVFFEKSCKVSHLLSFACDKIEMTSVKSDSTGEY